MWLSSKACSRPNDSAVHKSDRITTASRFYRHILILQREDAGASGSWVSSFAFLADALASMLLSLNLCFASEEQVAGLQRDQITLAAVSPERSLGPSHAGQDESNPVAAKIPKLSGKCCRRFPLIANLFNDCS